MASGRLFGNEGWNPTVILGRIGALQLVFYASYYTALVILAMCLGTSLHPDYMLRGDSVTVLTSFGWAGVIAWFIADVVCALSMPYIVVRAKRCWDYAVTTLFLHLVVSCLYGGFPTGWTWWLVSLVSFVITTALGEYTCMRFEMMDIGVDEMLGRGASGASAPRAPEPQSTSARGTGTGRPAYTAKDRGSPNSMHGEAASLPASMEGVPLLRARSAERTPATPPSRMVLESAGRLSSPQSTTHEDAPHGGVAERSLSEPSITTHEQHTGAGSLGSAHADERHVLASREMSLPVAPSPMSKALGLSAKLAAESGRFPHTPGSVASASSSSRQRTVGAE